MLSLIIAMQMAPAVETRIDTVPAVGRISTAAVGSKVLERFPYNLSTGARPLGDVYYKWPMGNSARVPAGTLMLLDEEAGEARFCEENRKWCAIDRDRDGKLDRISWRGESSSKKLKVPVPYTSVPVRYEIPGGFRQSLTFLGVSGSTLRLGYREFSNNMARPAFSEDLTFPLTSRYPQDIAFRDVTITIYGISGTGMRYVVR